MALAQQTGLKHACFSQWHRAKTVSARKTQNQNADSRARRPGAASGGRRRRRRTVALELCYSLSISLCTRAFDCKCPYLTDGAWLIFYRAVVLTQVIYRRPRARAHGLGKNVVDVVLVPKLTHFQDSES